MFRTLVAALALATISVAVPGAAAQSRPATAQASKPPVSTPININTATAADLQRLPGIGAKTAARVIEYRQKNGPFKKVEELMNVRGIGERNFLRLKDQVSVGAPKPAAQQ